MTGCINAAVKWSFDLLGFALRCGSRCLFRLYTFAISLFKEEMIVEEKPTVLTQAFPWVSASVSLDNYSSPRCFSSFFPQFRSRFLNPSLTRLFSGSSEQGSCAGNLRRKQTSVKLWPFVSSAIPFLQFLSFFFFAAKLFLIFSEHKRASLFVPPQEQDFYLFLLYAFSTII